MLRSILVVIAAFAAGFFGFLLAAYFASKPLPPSQPQSSTAKPSPPAAVQPLVQTPTRVSAADAEPSPADREPERARAPQGTFFLTERVTHTTDAGVMGVDAGTKVIVLEKLANGNLLVTDGPEDFEVTPSQITSAPKTATRAPSRANPTSITSQPQQQQPSPQSAPPLANRQPRTPQTARGAASTPSASSTSFKPRPEGSAASGSPLAPARVPAVSATR